MRNFVQVERLRQLLPSRQPLKLKGRKRKAAEVQQLPERTPSNMATAKLVSTLLPPSEAPTRNRPKLP
jgi:hypothetical protein